MMKKSIGAKVFKTILAVALMFGILIGMVAIGQLLIQKKNVDEINKRYEQELTGETETQLNQLNKEVAGNLTDLYGTIVNDNFVSVRTLAQSVANYVGSLYSDGSNPAENEAAFTGEIDGMVGYMPGADPSSLAAGVGMLGSVRQYIATQEEYNPKNQDILDIYVVTETGICLDGTGKMYEGVYPELRNTDWYIGAKDSGKPYWAKVFTGTISGIKKITCGVPFYDGSGEFRGVAAVDLAIDHIYDTALAVRSEQVEHVLLMDADAAVMINPDNYDIGDVNPAEGLYMKDGGFLSFVDIPETNWTMCLVFRFELVQDTITNMVGTIQQNSAEVGTVMDEMLARSIMIFFVILLAGCVPVFFLSRKMSSGLSAPIKYLAQEVGTIGEGNLDYKIGNINTGDEIELLADSFNDMTEKLKVYVENLAAVTSEKERIGAELDVAKHIQASMLPCIFPAFPYRPELDIYATMTPAKEVGGDFYDFFLVDDDHLVMVMADVSGKGVPAALFMVITKTLIKNCAQTGQSPAAVLEKVNSQLCENNEAELFVTVWLCIVEISTGKLIAANAGHEYPVLKRAEGNYELIKDKHGFVLAGMEGTRYKEYELTLAPGDKFYLYTDGVTEATNADNELYGTKRMLDVLNRNKDTCAKELLQQIKADIDTFVGETPQFDDITMLTLELREQAGSMPKRQIKPTLENIDEVTAFVEQELDSAEVPMKAAMQMNIAVDEIFSNIARYSSASDATVGCIVKNEVITLRFADNGLPYDPTTNGDPNISLKIEEREVGGLGIFMVKKFMDEVIYEYRDGLNILTLKKNLS